MNTPLIVLMRKDYRTQLFLPVNPSKRLIMWTQMVNQRNLKPIIQRFSGLVVLTVMNYLLLALIFGQVLLINSMPMQAGAGL